MTEAMQGSKRCPLCDVVKPLDAFARNGRRKDGRGTYCRPCAREKYHVPARERNRLVPAPVEGKRKCRTCSEIKAFADFYWKADQARFSAECRECKGVRDRAGWRAGRGRAQRTKQLRVKFALTNDEYAALLTDQGGGCAICGDPPPPDRALAVDHDHATGARRSLLCGRCNPGLGQFRDDPRLLRLAALYLESHSGVSA